MSEDLETLMKGGKEALENDDLDKADKLLHQALELDPNNADLHVDLGRVFVKLKKTVEAREHYQKALEVDPNSFRPLQALGRLETNLGNQEKALKLFLQALDLKPKSEDCADINVDIGNLYFEFSQLEMAQEYYNLAIEQNPSCARAYNNLGNIALRQEKRAESLEFYKKAVTFDNKNILFKRNLARGYFYDGIYEAAEDLFLDVLEQSNDETVLSELGRCFYYSRQYKKAIETLTNFVAKTDDTYLLSCVYPYLGRAYTQLHQFDDAIEQWFLSLKYFEDADTYKEIGQIKKYQGKPQEALEYYEKALHSSPKDFSEILDLIWDTTFLREGDSVKRQPKEILELAIQILKNFTNNFSGIALAYYYIAVLYCRLDKLKEENIYAEKACEIDPLPHYLFQLIMSNFKLKKYKAAEQAFETYLQVIYGENESEKFKDVTLGILEFCKNNLNNEITARFENNILKYKHN